MNMFSVFRPGFCLYTLPAFRKFKRHLADPDRAQTKVFQEILGMLAQTSYGQHYGVTESWCYSDFRERLPMVNYEDLRPWMDLQVKSESSVVTPDKVLYYEPTSGSSGAAKMIPFTDRMRRSFSNSFAFWLHDILNNGPKFKTGKLFYSVSPNLRAAEQTENGVDIGLEDDSDYLSGLLAPLVRRISAVPPELKTIRDPHSFRLYLAASLLASPDLELMYIWSPSFLQILLKFMEENREYLISCLANREIRLQGKCYPLAKVSKDHLGILMQDQIVWQRVWPQLKLISCWASGHARIGAQSLAAVFPQALVQPKGLLATEAPLTVPLLGAPAGVPLVSDVFFEFIDEKQSVLRLSELKSGGEYEVVVTQKGGLYRYRMGDRVRVDGFSGRTPCLEFTGRAGSVVDMVGEKLNEEFVSNILASVSGNQNEFFVVVPVPDSETPNYRLVTNSGRDVQQVANRIEAELNKAHHYDLARKLGQLSPLTVTRLGDARERYFSFFQRKGMKWGDIKDRGLMTDLDDAKKFAREIGVETEVVSRSRAS